MGTLTAETEQLLSVCKLYLLPGSSYAEDMVNTTSSNLPRHHAIIPIENTLKYFGFLLAGDFVSSPERIKIMYLSNVRYARVGKSWWYEFLWQPSLIPFRMSFFNVDIEKIGDVFVARAGTPVTPTVHLPLASSHPYTLAEITDDEYNELRTNFDSKENRRRSMQKCVEQVVDILSGRTDSSKVPKSLFSRAQLLTPPGYADRKDLGYGESSRLPRQRL